MYTGGFLLPVFRPIAYYNIDPFSVAWDDTGMEARTITPDTVAPWAEIVPGIGAMTVADLLHWPDDDAWRFELVEGVLVRVAGSRPKAVRVTMRLLRALDTFAEQHRLGHVTPPDAVY